MGEVACVEIVRTFANRVKTTENLILWGSLEPSSLNIDREMCLCNDRLRSHGIDFVEQTYNIDNYRIQLQIWDTAGQERYRSLATSTFRDAKAFVIVYDITSRHSFNRIREEWLQMTDVSGGEPVPVFFVGNKADLSRLMEVPTADAQKLAKQQYAHGFFETSALTGHNVENLFCSVATSMVSTWGIPQFDLQATPSAYNGTAFALSDQGSVSTNKKRKRRSTVFQCC